MGSEDVVEFTAGQLLDVIHDILIERKEVTEKAFEKEWNTRKLGKILERMHIPKKQTKERLRIVDKPLLKKLKETYGPADVTDITDVSIGHIQGNKPSKNEDLGQNKPVFEEENIDRHAIVTSVTSKTSVNALGLTRDKNQEDTKDEVTGKYSKLEKDIIYTIKNPPLERQIYKFELITFLEQRGHRTEDIERALDKLIKEGTVIQHPDEKLDLNFSKFHSGGGQ